MPSQPFKFIFLSSLGLSLFLGNSVAFAQYNDSTSDGVVVPTIPSGSSTSTSTGTSIPINTSTGTSTSPSVVSGTRFFCQPYNGQYTVMYQPQSQPGRYFPWAVPGRLGGGWDEQSRCVAIANRLESYRPDGLQELQTGFLNNQNIVCVTTEANPSCRIVLTVPPGKDVYTVRNNIFQNLLSADSGQDTIGVNTYRNSRSTGVNDIYNLGRTLLGGGNNNRTVASRGGINLKPFLDPKDGGTAKGLQNGITIRRQSQPSQVPTRLNPGNFR